MSYKDKAIAEIERQILDATKVYTSTGNKEALAVRDALTKALEVAVS